MKKLISLVLCFVFVFALIPISSNVLGYETIYPDLVDDQELWYALSDDKTYYILVFCGQYNFEDNVEFVEGIDLYLDEIVIPEHINGIPVTEIYESAFAGCNHIKSIIIPKTITKIGNWAFEGCEYLNNLYIPKSVDYIGRYAFADTNKLENIYCEAETMPYEWDENAFEYSEAKIHWNVFPPKTSASQNTIFSIGDVDANGIIDSMDYVLIKRAYFGLYKFDENAAQRADINNNGEIDSFDYVSLKRAYFGTFNLNSIDRTPDSNGKWDNLLVNCENKYFVVQKTVETYNSLTYQVGVVDIYNNWFIPLSSENALAQLIASETGKITLNGTRVTVDSDNFYYLGNGVVVGSLGVNVDLENGRFDSVGKYSSTSSSGLTAYFFNIERNVCFSYDAHKVSTVIDGYIFIRNHNDWIRVTDIGADSREFVAKVGPYSEGLFLGTPDSNWHDDEYYFYDINGRRMIDLSEFDIQNPATTKFVGDVCEIRFKNPAGTLYAATIDKKGKFVVEPYKVYG